MQFFYEKQVNILKILTKQCPKNMSGQWEGNKLYYRNEIQKQYEYKFKLII